MSDIKEYIERYCKSNNVTPEEAKSHKLVQEVVKYYEETQRKGR